MAETPAEKALKLYVRLEKAGYLIEQGGEEIAKIFRDVREKSSTHLDAVFWDEWLSRMTDLNTELAAKREKALAELLALTLRPERPVEVTSDGQKVWVNIGGMCAARFGHRSYEVTSVDPDVSQTVLASGRYDGTSSPFPWVDFKEAVLKHHHVIVEEKHKPDWVKS